MLALDRFLDLEKEQKINYLNEITSVFSESDSILWDLAKLINTLPSQDLTDELLGTTYKIIFEAVETQKWKIKEQEIEKLQKINKKIELLKQQEEQEKADADKLLENL